MVITTSYLDHEIMINMALISLLLETQNQPNSHVINCPFSCTFTFLSMPLFPNICHLEKANKSLLEEYFLSLLSTKRKCRLGLGIQIPGQFHLTRKS